jgi:phosphoenolpyruvate carboxykinase (ATP)
MALSPVVYAEMLGDKIEKHGVQVWLINTGWTGGPHGEGHRINLPYTRSMVRAALDGRLNNVPYVEDRIFGLRIPKEVPDVPTDILLPGNTWKDPKAYNQKAKELVNKFRKAFEEFENDVKTAVKEAGPKVE